MKTIYVTCVTIRLRRNSIPKKRGGRTQGALIPAVALQKRLSPLHFFRYDFPALLHHHELTALQRHPICNEATWQLYDSPMKSKGEFKLYLCWVSHKKKFDQKTI
jgi:hypothetical protein